MDIYEFDKKIKPLLEGFSFECSSLGVGDFGELQRIDVEGFNKIGTVDLWSRGWVAVDIYDCVADEQIMNILVSSDESILISKIFQDFVRLLKSENL